MTMMGGGGGGGGTFLKNDLKFGGGGGGGEFPTPLYLNNNRGNFDVIVSWLYGNTIVSTP